MSEDDEDKDRQQIDDNVGLRSPIVYAIVRAEGEEELARPTPSLWWSGVAAGLVMGTSVMGRAALRHHLPDAPWSMIIESFGYTLGFVIVIIARLQLFTENTITPVLPLLARPSLTTLRCVARLWGIVLFANIVGTFVSALLLVKIGSMPSEYLPALLSISHQFADKTPMEALGQGIPAGFLIASLVWMGPTLQGTKVLVIVLVTHLIALAELSHVIVGSVELFILLLHGELSVAPAFLGLFLPTFFGNVLGGTGLFAMLAYAQVRQEIE